MEPNMRYESMSPLTNHAAPVFKFGFFKAEIAHANHKGEKGFTARCQMCNKFYTHYRFINTSTLKHHLRTKHKGHLITQGEQAYEDIQDGKLKFEDTILATNLLEGLKIRDRPITDFCPKEQNNLKSSSGDLQKNRGLIYKPDDIQRIIINMIMANNLCFNFCENLTTKSCVKYANPGLQKVVSRSLITKKVVEIYLQDLEALRKELVINEGRFALSIDEWKHNNENNVLEITLHFYDNFFELKNYIIGFEVIKKENLITRELLMKFVQNVIVNLALEGRILSITRYNPGPMNTAFELLGKKNSICERDLRCAGHIINRSAESILKYTYFRTKNSRAFIKSSQKIDENYPSLKAFSNRMKSLPNIIRRIVKSIQNELFFQSTFEKIVESRKLADNHTLGPETLLLDDETQWLSTYYMIDRFLRFRKEINYILERARSLNKTEQEDLGFEVLEISDFEWEYLLNLHKVLGFFYTPIFDIQSFKKSTISVTIPHVHLLLQNLEAFNTDILKATNPYLAEGLLEAYKKLYEYFPIQNHGSEEMLNFYLATVLDPRFKIKFFEKKGFSTFIISRIKRYFSEMYLQYKKEYEKKEKKSESATSSENPSNTQSKSKLSFLTCFLDDEPVDDEEEVMMYLKTKREKGDSKAHDFYRSQRETFPIIYEMAKDFLAIPATSFPSESLFCQNGNGLINEENVCRADPIKSLAFVDYRAQIVGLERLFEGIE